MVDRAEVDFGAELKGGFANNSKIMGGGNCLGWQSIDLRETELVVSPQDGVALLGVPIDEELPIRCQNYFNLFLLSSQ